MAQSFREHAVLHVDDCLNDQLLVQEAARLSQSRLIFIPVATFASALAYLGGSGPFAVREQYPIPDLLLVDWKLDGTETGLDLLRWVRAREGLSRMPVVMYSGTGGEEEVREFYLSGGNHFLVKASEFARIVPVVSALQHWLDSTLCRSDLLLRLLEYRAAADDSFIAQSCQTVAQSPRPAPLPPS